VDADNDTFYGYNAQNCPAGNDCRDDVYEINPGRPEECDDTGLIDENCDGLTNCEDPACLNAIRIMMAGTNWLAAVKTVMTHVRFAILLILMKTQVPVASHAATERTMIVTGLSIVKTRIVKARSRAAYKVISQSANHRSLTPIYA
jgi:hypothetical protein